MSTRSLNKDEAQDRDRSPEEKRRERAVVAEAAADAGVPKIDSGLDGAPGLGGGRGLPGSGGGHHPGDDDGCRENSYRE